MVLGPDYFHGPLLTCCCCGAIYILYEKNGNFVCTPLFEDQLILWIPFALHVFHAPHPPHPPFNLPLFINF